MHPRLANPVTLVGELALWVALLMAAWGAIVSFAGGRVGRADLIASGERALYAAFACIVLATAGTMAALVRSDFSFRYVASVTSANLPVAYKLIALWAGQAGSLLVWALLLSTHAAIVLGMHRVATREYGPCVAGALSTILLFFLAAMCLGASPYERLSVMPVEGQGMHPQLQSPGMVVQPPLLYVGYVGTAVLCAFAIAALLVRQLSDGWVSAVRRWAALSWFFLTAGIFAGMWWAYIEPDRAGHWALDPLVSFSIVPWVSTTGLLYSLSLGEQRAVFRRWSLGLAASTFWLVLTATFITRNGVIASVHAHGRSDLGTWLGGVVAVSGVAVAYLIATRLRDVRVAMSLESAATRAKSSSLTRRVGHYMVRAGGVALAAAFVGLSFATERDVTLGPGEVATLMDPYGRRWAFTSQGVSQFAQLNRRVIGVPLRAVSDGKPLGLIGAERRQYVDSRGLPTFEAAAEAGIDYSPMQDVYVVLAGVVRDRAQLRIAFNPLAVWVWLGGAALAIGGLMLAWPPPTQRASHA